MNNHAKLVQNINLFFFALLCAPFMSAIINMATINYEFSLPYLIFSLVGICVALLYLKFNFVKIILGILLLLYSCLGVFAVFPPFGDETNIPFNHRFIAWCVLLLVGIVANINTYILVKKKIKNCPIKIEKKDGLFFLSLFLFFLLMQPLASFISSCIFFSPDFGNIPIALFCSLLGYGYLNYIFVKKYTKLDQEKASD